MNKTLASSGRDILKSYLSQLEDRHHKMFKLMYARDGGKRSVEDAVAMDINDVVDIMEDSKISTAITQCETTLSKLIS